MISGFKMQSKTLAEIEKKFELEIPKIIKNIKKRRAKRILLQFPEGLKPYSTVIADEIERKTNAKCFIWLGSCYGGCDIPLGMKEMGIDLIVQFGHSPWNHKKGY